MEIIKKLKKLKLGKKAQVMPTPTTLFLTKFIGSILVVFGMIQAFVFIYPNGGLWLQGVIQKYFMGSTAFFLFVGAGLLGMAINVLLERYEARVQPLWDKHTWAFFLTGAGVLGLGFLLKFVGVAPAAMILP